MDDYGSDYDFSNWFDDSYGEGYTPAEGSSVGSGVEEGGTFGDWSQGNYDYTYGNTSDYGNDYWNNLNNGVSSYGNLNTGVGSGFNSANWGTPNPMATIDTANPFGSISTTLSSIFNNPNAMKMGAAGLSALLEGYQNKKKADAMKQAAKQIDPWASQRPFYQQQAQAAVTNPYDSPIVKAQIEQLQNAQNIKDAAAGRRSNSLTSSPAVMAEMAKIAQAYQAQMANQGGASIQPSGLAQTLGAASTYDVNGYLSPLAALLGNYAQSNVNKAA